MYIIYNAKAFFHYVSELTFCLQNLINTSAFQFNIYVIDIALEFYKESLSNTI